MDIKGLKLSKTIILALIIGVILGVGGYFGGSWLGTRIESQNVVAGQFSGSDIGSQVYLKKTGNLVNSQNAAWDFSWGGSATSSSDFWIDAGSGHVAIPGISGSTQCLHVDSNGLISGTGSDCGAGGGSGMELHGLLGEWQSDVTPASVSANSLIYGGETTWKLFAAPTASGSFLQFNGTSLTWDDYNDRNTTYTAKEPLSLVGTEFDIDLASTGGDGYLSKANWDTFNAKQATMTASDPISIIGVDISIDTASAGDNGILSAANWSTFNNKQDALTFQSPLVNVANTVSASWASAGDAGFLTTADWTTFNNKQATITDGTNLTFAGATLNVDDPFSVTNLTATYASTSQLTATTGADIASVSANTYWGAGLVDCDTAATSKLLWSDTGVFSCGTDTSGAGAPVAHGLLSDYGHNDVSNASASAGALIFGSGTTWTPLAVGASNSFLLSDGTNPIYKLDPDIASMSITDLKTSTLTGTLTGDLTCTDCLNATEIEDIYFLTAGDNASASVLTIDSADITSASFGTINLPNDSIQEADIDFDTACAAGNHYYLNGNDLACETDDNTTYTVVGDPLGITGTVIDIDYASASQDGFLLGTDWDIFNAKWDGLTDMVLTDTYIYVGNGSNDPVGVAMSSDCTLANTGAITCDHDALNNFVANEHIDWTAASSSFHTAADKTFEVDGTASISSTLSVGGTITGNLTGAVTGNASTATALAANGANCPANQYPLGIDANGAVEDCTADAGTTYTATNPLSLVGTAFGIDYASASGGGYLTFNNWEDFNGKLSSLSVDTSAEIITIVGDETGSGHLVFDTSPELTTSFTTTGVFAINPGGALTIGDNGDTLYLNSSDWDIGTTGDMTGIGALTMDGLFSGAGASLSGDLDILGDLSVASATFTTLAGTLTGDLTCTDCLNATEIEDIYLLDDGDVGTGAYDFGGASLELPNGTSITLDANGEAGVDTTGGQFNYYSDEVNILMATQSFGFVMSSTSLDGTLPDTLHQFEEPITITAIYCECKGAACSINMELEEVDTDSDNPTDIDSAITCTNAEGDDDGSLTNPGIATLGGVRASVDYSTFTGGLDWLSVTVFYKFTAQ